MQIWQICSDFKVGSKYRIEIENILLVLQTRKQTNLSLGGIFHLVSHSMLAFPEIIDQINISIVSSEFKEIFVSCLKENLQCHSLGTESVYAGLVVLRAPHLHHIRILNTITIINIITAAIRMINIVRIFSYSLYSVESQPLYTPLPSRQ